MTAEDFDTIETFLDKLYAGKIVIPNGAEVYNAIHQLTMDYNNLATADVQITVKAN